MEKQARFDGVQLTLGGDTYTVPPLSLGQCQKYEDVISKLGEVDENEKTFATFTRALPMLHAAFSRNYPDMTLDAFSDLVDISTFRVVLSAVMKVSGMEPGEAPAVQAVQ